MKLIRTITFLLILFSFESFGQVVGHIKIEGANKTKASIILRELTFNVGDTIFSTDTLGHKTNSENNLFNTSLFNFTEVVFNDSNEVWNVTVNVQERWYLWPELILSFQERNFSEWWKNKDLSRLNIGLHINQFNFLGLNQTIQFNGYYGFNERLGFKYKIPYLSKKMRDGIKISANYGTQNEVYTGILNNEMVYTKNDSANILSRFNVQFEYFRRTGFYLSQFLNFEFIQLQGYEELQSMTNHYFGNSNAFLKYFKVGYRIKYDKRFSRNYPLKGYFLDFAIHQDGLGIVDKSNLNVTSIVGHAKWFKQLYKRNYFATSFHFRQFIQNDIPFLFSKGLGFHEYVRGYEPYVIQGQSSFLAKTNYKFQIIKPQSYTLPVIKKIKRFSKIHFAMYWNVFLDAGYVAEDEELSNSFLNSTLIGGGTGLDWVTYYDVVFRTEYTVNKNGGHQFNLAFIAPI